MIQYIQNVPIVYISSQHYQRTLNILVRIILSTTNRTFLFEEIQSAD